MSLKRIARKLRRRRAEIELISPDNEVLKILAEKLELQADGGDDPVEFLSECILDAQKQVRINEKERELLLLRRNQ